MQPQPGYGAGAGAVPTLQELLDEAIEGPQVFPLPEPLQLEPRRKGDSAPEPLSEIRFEKGVRAKDLFHVGVAQQDLFGSLEQVAASAAGLRPGELGELPFAVSAELLDMTARCVFPLLRLAIQRAERAEPLVHTQRLQIQLRDGFTHGSEELGELDFHALRMKDVRDVPMTMQQLTYGHVIELASRQTRQPIVALGTLTLYDLVDVSDTVLGFFQPALGTGASS